MADYKKPIKLSDPQLHSTRLAMLCEALTGGDLSALSDNDYFMLLTVAKSVWESEGLGEKIRKLGELIENRKFLDHVRYIASEIFDEIKDGTIKSTSDLSDRIGDAAGASGYVIYTYRNFQVMAFSTADVQEVMEDHAAGNPGQVAYWCLHKDIEDSLEYMAGETKIDLENEDTYPANQDTEADDEGED